MIEIKSELAPNQIRYVTESEWAEQRHTVYEHWYEAGRKQTSRFIPPEIESGELKKKMEKLKKEMSAKLKKAQKTK